MTKKSIITQDFLRSILNYNQDTGLFIYKINRSRTAKKGSVAGTIDEGYIRIIIRGKSYRANRLAWFYVHGVWPTVKVDHINCDTLDNRFVNLRLADDNQSANNKKKYKNNKSGYKGVSWKAANNKWVAQIQANGKGIHLGLFDTAYEAHLAYSRASLKYHGKYGRSI